MKNKKTNFKTPGVLPLEAISHRPRIKSAGGASSSRVTSGKVLKLGALQAAPLLLGWTLCRFTPKGVIKLRIVETEAYHQDEPASHSFRGKTLRTAPMFEAGGRLYIYFTYGMHHAINIVVGKKGVGEAVLLRAGEPVGGTEFMRANRGLTDIKKLANGPGKLAQALGITDTSLSGKILDPGRKILNKSSISYGASKSSNYADIWLEPPAEKVNAENIVASPRVGITKAAELPWRFYIKDNSFVSRPAKI